MIDGVGSGVIGWTEGTRVGVGWFGGHCGRCEPCRRGYLVDCRNLRIPGINYDGGYAEAIIDSQDTLAFSALSGVRPTIETMPLERAADAYDKMMRNEARFRMVLTTGL